MVTLIEAEANNLLKKLHYHNEQKFKFKTSVTQLKKIYTMPIHEGLCIDQRMMVQKLNKGIDINNNVVLTVARSQMLDKYHDDFDGVVQYKSSKIHEIFLQETRMTRKRIGENTRQVLEANIRGRFRDRGGQGYNGHGCGGRFNR